MILIVIGTRPEIIKMSPIIRECARKGLDFSVLHTGQHYSYAMDKIFFEQLDLPPQPITWMSDPARRRPRQPPFLPASRTFFISIPRELSLCRVTRTRSLPEPSLQ